MKPLIAFCTLLFGASSILKAQQVDFDAVDSLIETTPAIALCKKDGKDDLRFFSKTPEKYANFKQEFLKQALETFTFDAKSHFYCDITVEVNCKGEAGNYTFAIEPRTFNGQDFEYFKQLIALVNKLRGYSFVPAFYLGENVNSKVRFRMAAKEGKVTLL